ncbi:MAG: (Fe-S)-binding protein [Conexivisphaerales archaeon]
MKNQIKIKDFSKESMKPLVKLEIKDLMKLVLLDDEPSLKEPPQFWTEKYNFSLDGHAAIGIPVPQNDQEKEDLVKKFLNGLEKELTSEGNWTFLQQVLLSLDYCAKCGACEEACPIYIASGKKNIYSPLFRSELFRRLYRKHFTTAGRLFGKVIYGDIDETWQLITRLIELSYRCNICRRCAQACPIGIDNGLIAHEIRKIASQEMGIAAKELHEKGTVIQLNVGSSTGLNPEGFKRVVKMMEEDIQEKAGLKIKIPVDVKGADILLIHNAGEYISWIENPEAYAIIFEKAGLSWTLSSEPVGYDSVNYGVWYDDVQLARIALRHVEIAHKLGVKKIVVGECGHATKALVVTAERLLTKDNYIPRESVLPLLSEVVEKFEFDPERNRFPVTLHDPCNIVRLSGIVEPQRKVLKKVAPLFREMEPHGVCNYCCGGGSGFAIMHSYNFDQWKNKVAARMKVNQILEAFKDEINPGTYKYVCAPCSNCKGEIRDFITHYKLWEKFRINYGGLAELVVNAMPEINSYINTNEFK